MPDQGTDHTGSSPSQPNQGGATPPPLYPNSAPQVGYPAGWGHQVPPQYQAGAALPPYEQGWGRQPPPPPHQGTAPFSASQNGWAQPGPPQFDSTGGQPLAGPQFPQPPQQLRPWYKRKLVIIGSAVAVLLIWGASQGADPSSDTAGLLPTTSTSSSSLSSATKAASKGAVTSAPAQKKSSSPAASIPRAVAAPRIGVPATSGSTSLVATKVQALNSLRSSWLGDKKGNWVLVDVSATNTGKKPSTISGSDFTLVASDGAEYETDVDNMTYIDDDFFLENLNPKMTIKGQVLFAVPGGFAVEKSTLVFYDSWLSSPAKIQLHR